MRLPFSSTQWLSVSGLGQPGVNGRDGLGSKREGWIRE